VQITSAFGYILASSSVNARAGQSVIATYPAVSSLRPFSITWSFAEGCWISIHFFTNAGIVHVSMKRSEGEGKADLLLGSKLRSRCGRRGHSGASLAPSRRTLCLSETCLRRSLGARARDLWGLRIVDPSSILYSELYINCEKFEKLFACVRRKKTRSGRFVVRYWGQICLRSVSANAAARVGRNVAGAFWGWVGTAL
jgi:hypothetical protein